MNLRVTVAADTATPKLQAALALLENKGPLVGAMGRRVIRDTSRHVAQWGLAHPNKLGGRRTNYWAGIAAKINPGDCLKVSGETATVTLGGPEMPGLLRAFGEVKIVPGTKTPGVKYLAIPARTETYGMRPREFSNLKIFWGKNGPAGLVEIDQQKVSLVKAGTTKAGGARKSFVRPGPVSGGLVMFWFAKSVTQPQDRSLLPSDQQWNDSANAAAREWVDLKLSKLQGGAN